MSSFTRTTAFSVERLEKLRKSVADVVPSDELIVTCGSYARREAVSDSDLDFFSVASPDSEPAKPAWFPGLESQVKKVIGKLPSRDGAFSEVVSQTELLSNYGGSNDTNNSITRRMLYLLEGEYLTNQDRFLQLRRSILESYVGNTRSDHQIAFYLLNDIIRYWRTIAVDYAHKTYGAPERKPWAIRNVKLVFSRKLIYASGLFSVALTADRREHHKVEILDRLFSMTPIDRVKYICGESQSKRLFELYDFFLSKMEDDATRKHLNSLREDQKTTDDIFREIKNEGHYFSRELMGLFHKTFHSSHPIHMAVIF